VSYRTNPENIRTENEATNKSKLALKGRNIWTKDVVIRPMTPAKRKGPRKLKSH
jgi:hypothetical protein